MKPSALPQKYLRLVALGIILVVVIGTIFTAAIASRVLEERTRTQFDKKVDAQTDFVLDTMTNYSSLLYAGRAYLTSSVEVTQKEWDSYFREQNAFERYEGLSTIGFAKYFTESERPAFLASMRENAHFGGINYEFTVDKPRASYVVTSLICTNNTINKFFGSDLSAREPQRSTMATAVKSGKPEATAPYTLSTGLPGFALFMAVFKDSELQGYNYVSFRTADLMKILFPETDSSLAYKIDDVTGGDNISLYTSSHWTADEALERQDKINVAGRIWRISFASDKSNTDTYVNRLVPILIFVMGLTFAALLLAAFYIFLRDANRKSRPQ